MSSLYAETSAVLRWLLGAPGGEDVKSALAGADVVFASRLTLVEARRTLTRASLLKELSEAGHQAASSALDRAASLWTLVSLTEEILDRATQRFPVEPVRTLDAIHLATVLYVNDALGPLSVLTTDERIMSNARSFDLALALSPR